MSVEEQRRELCLAPEYLAKRSEFRASVNTGQHKLKSENKIHAEKN